MKIAVAMSGGVDSSVGAALLKDAGHEVTGVTLGLWGTETDSEPAVSSARETCRILNIPHETLDFRVEFRHLVVGYFLDEYTSGLTPNPCVRCNEHVKFGLLLQAARRRGAERLATGHYARIAFEPTSSPPPHPLPHLWGEGLRERGRHQVKGKYALLKAVDGKKDQSYFLYRLTQEQLAFLLFPLGGMTKDEVKNRAHALGLPAASREESQEVCFIPGDDYRAFIERERPESVQPGEFVDKEGNVLGIHRGVAFYTVGQRKGLGVSSPAGRRYVIERDPLTRRIVLGGEDELRTTGCTVGDVNWVSGAPPDGPVGAEIKLRYRFEPVKGTIGAASGGDSPLSLNPSPTMGGGTVIMQFDQPSPGVSPGQSAVFYKGDRVMGGGIILK